MILFWEKQSRDVPQHKHGTIIIWSILVTVYLQIKFPLKPSLCLNEKSINLTNQIHFDKVINIYLSMDCQFDCFATHWKVVNT